MGFSNMMMAAAKSMPKSTMTQSMPSRTFSSCSTTNMWWLKNCWSFSFTKLMEICSKPLYSKISKPAMSSTAQKLAFFMVASIRVSLHLMIGHLKILSKMARAIPPVAMVACSQVWPLVTHSVPTLILGLQNALKRAAAGQPKPAAAFPAKVSGAMDATTGHDGGGEHVARELLLRVKAQDVEGVLGVEQLLIVIDGVDLGLTLGDIDVVVDVGRHEALGTETSLADAVSVRLEQLVEDVVGPLDLLLLGDTGLLEQVGHDVTTAELAAGGEVDTDEFTETGGVVVPRGLGVSVGLQDGVGSHNLVLKGDLLGFLLGTSSSSGHHGQVGDHLLGVLGLSGTRLTGDQHGVVLLVLEHVPVGALSDGPQMGWALVPPLAKVDLAHPVGVKRVALVRVDNHDEETGVGVDQLGLVAGLQVPEDGGVVEVGQVDHVLALLELGRVDTANLASLEGELLVRHGDGHLDAEVGALHAKLGDVAGLKKTLLVAVGLGVLDPDGGLGIVRLGLVLLLHVHGGP